ncbi:unnamed protein product [Penicillium viridicatum]
MVLTTVIEGEVDIDTRTRPNNERTPLLAGRHNANSRGSGTEGDGAGDQYTVDRNQNDFQDLPWWKRPSIWWMLPPYLLFTVAFGGVTVPKLNLILDLICRKYYGNKAAEDPTVTYITVIFDDKGDQCRNAEVQSLAAQFSLVANFIGGIMSAFSCPRLGALSDRYGRTRVLSVTAIGMLSGEIITIAAATYPDSVEVYWLYLGYILDGICGSFIAGMAVAHSYAADCTAPEDRNIAFGYFHGCLFGGIALGPLLAALAIKASGGYLLVFYLVLFCQLVFIFSMLWVVPESLSRSSQLLAREAFSHRRMTNRNTRLTWSSWLSGKLFTPFAPLKILWPRGEGSSPALRRNLVLLAAVDTTMFGVAMGAFNVVIYYSRYQFGWDVSEQSLFIAIINLARISCMLFVLPVVTRLVRGAVAGDPSQPWNGCDNLDLAFIRCAVFFDALGFLGYAVATSPTLFIIFGAMTALAGLGFPTLQSAMTKHIPPSQTGELLGASGLLHSLARVVAPAFLSGIYSLTVGSLPQSIFIILTVVFGIAACLSWGIRPGVYWGFKEAPRREPLQEEAAEA